MLISEELSKAIEHYLEQSATAEEILLVNDWYHSFNDEHLVITTQEKNLKDKIDAMLRARLAETTGVSQLQDNPVRSIKPLKRFIAVAAAVLLVSGAALYFYNLRNSAAQSFEYNNTLPGRSIAKLTLANGREIILSDSLKGQLTEEAGVRITKTSDGQIVYTVVDQKAGLKSGVPEFNTIETPKGGKYQVNLPDGTKIWLNAASTLRYPSRFAGEERKVELSGEAYFEVAKVMVKGSKNRRMPFVVKTDKQLVEVLGTHFNINDYREDDAVKTTLLEGSVRVKQLASKNTTLLKPGQQSILQTGILKVKEADLAVEMAWRNGEFIFTSNDFRAEMRKMARWYNVDVVFDDSAPVDFELGGFVSHSKNISDILGLIELTGKVHFKIEGRRVIVTR